MAVKIWANRGASYYMPENSMDAFKLAKKQKADGIKLDVAFTKDGHVVILHDEVLENSSDGKGLLKDFTLDELKKLNFNKKYPKIERVEIATLEEVFKFAKNSELSLNVEFRTLRYQYKGLVKRVLEMAEKADLKNRIIYSSFNHETLMKLRSYDKKAKIAPAISDGYVNVVKYISKLEADYINPAFYLLENEELSKKARRRDIPLNVWGATTDEDIKWLLKEKVNAIITDRPDAVIAMRDKSKSEKEKAKGK